MKNIIKYIFLFHLLMFCAWAYPSTYTLRGLSVSDGLSDLLVNAIYKDSLGFVWIGTGILWSVLTEAISNTIR